MNRGALVSVLIDTGKRQQTAIVKSFVVVFAPSVTLRKAANVIFPFEESFLFETDGDSQYSLLRISCCVKQIYLVSLCSFSSCNFVSFACISIIADRKKKKSIPKIKSMP